MRRLPSEKVRPSEDVVRSGLSSNLERSFVESWAKLLNRCGLWFGAETGTIDSHVFRVCLDLYCL